MTKKKRTNFASWPKGEHRETSSKGGSNVPPDKRYFALHPDAASKAGQKGGAEKARRIQKGKRKS